MFCASTNISTLFMKEMCACYKNIFNIGESILSNLNDVSTKLFLVTLTVYNYFSEMALLRGMSSSVTSCSASSRWK